MANGLEDLKEKEKSDETPAVKVKNVRYSEWKNFQGREDAEMLQEKSSGWSAVKNNRGDYDYDDD